MWGQGAGSLFSVTSPELPGDTNTGGRSQNGGLLPQDTGGKGTTEAVKSLIQRFPCTTGGSTLTFGSWSGADLARPHLPRLGSRRKLPGWHRLAAGLTGAEG